MCSIRKAKPSRRGPEPVAATSANLFTFNNFRLIADPIFGYKIRVILIDFCNMSKDKMSEDVNFLRTVYSTEESACVRNAIVYHIVPSIKDQGESDDNEDNQ